MVHFRRSLDHPNLNLGEMFNCPYQTPCFPVYAEMEQGETWQRLSALAKKYKIYLSAGSVPEKDEEGHVYNTAYVFDPQGNQIAKHRKVHLFDIAVKGGQCYQTRRLGPSACSALRARGCAGRRAPKAHRRAPCPGLQHRPASAWPPRGGATCAWPRHTSSGCCDIIS